MLTSSTLEEANVSSVPTVLSFLKEMQQELQEFPFNQEDFSSSITKSFSEGAHWFIFKDENNTPFGTCYMQSLHNYWRRGKRFYLGGFYITPSHRKQGRFKQLNSLLRQWATLHGGVQIYAHIHKDNTQSLKAFQTVGLEQTDYLLCVNHWG